MHIMTATLESAYTNGIVSARRRDFVSLNLRRTETTPYMPPLSPEPPPETFARYMRRIRFSYDPPLTQTAVGEKWGFSQTAVSDIERGLRVPDREDIPALARALGRPESEVMEAAGYLVGGAELGPDEIVIESGRRVRLRRADGELLPPLEVDETVLRVLEALALGQKPTKERP